MSSDSHPFSKQTREQAVALYQAGLSQITPEYLVQQALKYDSDSPVHSLRIRFLETDLSERLETIALSKDQKIIVIAVGKAALPMATETKKILGQHVDTKGIIITKHGFGGSAPLFPLYESGHPIPDQAGVKAAGAAEALLKKLDERHILLALISGGASALLPAPPNGVSLADKQQLVDLMLHTNMDIHQINQVRKAVSRLKGGGLAAMAAPAKVIGLYLSDVPGDQLASVGSGLTAPEPVDHAAVIAILKERDIWSKVPASIQTVLGSAPFPKKTPVPPVNGIIGCNRHLLRAMNEAAQQQGYITHVVETPTTGLNPEAKLLLLQRWASFTSYHPDAKKLCLISGGETTVEVTGTGKGGRCQELAALMMPSLAAGDVFLAAGSDGNDGPTDAAGGVVDSSTWKKIEQSGQYQTLLDNHDSYQLLEQCGSLVKVPPTRNNVMDIHCFLRGN